LSYGRFGGSSHRSDPCISNDRPPAVHNVGTLCKARKANPYPRSLNKNGTWFPTWLRLGPFWHEHQLRSKNSGWIGTLIPKVYTVDEEYTDSMMISEVFVRRKREQCSYCLHRSSLVNGRLLVLLRTALFQEHPHLVVEMDSSTL